MPIKSKKFGAFAGVFTPSILTILGVIMYLRLGWVVGEAGLYAAIGIILLAHVISISTGLSISSIATDKKIKIGGIYYMLSRSLGLPIGGSIGITLFVGTALSISLYIVGFCESFLSLEIIRDFLGIGQTINDIRIVGTIVIIVLVIIAFISTSLAIKTQFIILAAIALSLISIFMGFFLNTEFHPEEILLSSSNNDIPLERIFAIFFPAVTGFTAGVAMSGDLKNPKKAIPFGTLSSILVGLIVYLGFAFGLAYFVNRDMLTTDYNFLLKIAYFSPLVIAGIWGATLSSALGGILGGPRILQAISFDRITPKIFSKTYGKNNEPRNALILTFFISEIGILIGDLDIIARLVTIFYISAYGFINLAYTLESWASTDFRPSFRLSKWVGIIGFIACFAVMFKLDTLAMAGAFVIFIGLYYIIRKKGLRLDLGDVWQSVRSSMIRSILKKMDRKELEERNWKPNIILFSGSANVRKYLVDFGKYLAGKHGFLSIFELIENKSAKVLFPKHKQSVATEENQLYDGIFMRRQACKDIYEGMEVIANTYGFSGVEPNTVLFGWAGQSKNPIRFAKTIKTLSDLDLNILMLNYNQEKGFGKKKLIDIWCRGGGNNGSLVLSLVKFLWLSEEWRNVKVRLLIINPKNDEKDILLTDADKVLETQRISAEVIIINNQIEQKPVREIIKNKSSNSDLVFLGIPPIIEGKEHRFSDDVIKLCLDNTSVVFVKASSYFQELQIGIKTENIIHDIRLGQENNLVIKNESDIPDLSLPEKNILREQISKLNTNLLRVNNSFFDSFLKELFEFHAKTIDALSSSALESFKQIQQQNSDRSTFILQQNIIKFHNSYLFKTRKVLDEFEKNILNKQKDLISEGISFLKNDIEKLINSLPENLEIEYSADELKTTKNDCFSLKIFKLSKRLKRKYSRKPAKNKIKYKKISEAFLHNNLYESLFEAFKNWSLITLQFTVEIQKFNQSVSNGFLSLEKKSTKAAFSETTINNEIERISQSAEKLKQINDLSLQSLNNFFLYRSYLVLKKLCDILQKIDPNSLISSNRENKSLNREINKSLNEIPGFWKRNQHYLFNSSRLELLFLMFEAKLRSIFFNLSSDIKLTIDNIFVNNYISLNNYFTDYIEKIKVNPAEAFSPKNSLDFNSEKFENEIKNIINSAKEEINLSSELFPKNIDLLSEEFVNDYTSTQFQPIELTNLSVSSFVKLLMKKNILEKIESFSTELIDKNQKSNTLVEDILKYITLSKKSGNSNVFTINEGSNKNSYLNFILEQQKILEQQISDSLNFKSKILQLCDQSFNVIADSLNLYSIINGTENNKQLTSGKERKKSHNIFSKLFKNFGHLSTDDLKNSDASNYLGKSISNKLIKLNNEVSANSEILEKLPFYYKQLFLQKQFYLQDFWVERKKEVSEAINFIKQKKSKPSGALMILGEHNSGKTFFAQYISKKLFTETDVFYISPPASGSVDELVFKESVEKSLKISGSYNSIFQNLQKDSIIIIDDIEMWWENRPDGDKVIKAISGLIESFGDKCCFILTSNIYSFRIIDKTGELEKHFSTTIELLPFKAKELKEIILSRHNSENLKFILNRKPQEKFKNRTYNRLFKGYFKYSKGNVGVALQAWIANIVKFENESLQMKKPQLPDLSVIDKLDEDICDLLTQFILHRKLTISKLQRILPTSENLTYLQINSLKICGIIIENNEEIFEINPFIYPFIVEKLAKMTKLKVAKKGK